MCVLMCLAGFPRQAQADQANNAIGPEPRSAIVGGPNGSIIFGDRGARNYGDLAVTIPAGSLLAGFGELEAKVFVSGKTEPGFVPFRKGTGWIWYWRDPIGKLTITGKYILEKEGVLVIDVTSPRKYDVLRVDGTANLSGTLRIDSLGYRPKPRDRIPFLLADRIEGRFLKIRTNLPGRFQYEFKSVGKIGYLTVSEGRGYGR